MCGICGYGNVNQTLDLESAYASYKYETVEGITNPAFYDHSVYGTELYSMFNYDIHDYYSYSMFNPTEIRGSGSYNDCLYPLEQHGAIEQDASPEFSAKLHKLCHGSLAEDYSEMTGKAQMRLEHSAFRDIQPSEDMIIDYGIANVTGCTFNSKAHEYIERLIKSLAFDELSTCPFIEAPADHTLYTNFRDHSTNFIFPEFCKDNINAAPIYECYHEYMEFGHLEISTMDIPCDWCHSTSRSTPRIMTLNHEMSPDKVCLAQIMGMSPSFVYVHLQNTYCII